MSLSPREWPIKAGENPVTGQWKWTPVTVQIMMERDCDAVLYESFWKLGDKGIVKTAQVCIRDPHAVNSTNQRITNHCRLKEIKYFATYEHLWLILYYREMSKRPVRTLSLSLKRAELRCKKSLHWQNITCLLIDQKVSI